MQRADNSKRPKMIVDNPKVDFCQYKTLLLLRIQFSEILGSLSTPPKLKYYKIISLKNTDISQE